MPASADDGARATSGVGPLRLGRRPAVGSIAGPPAVDLRLLAFSLNEEWYALDASDVQSIEPLPEITPIPWAPEWLMGVFNLRGAIVPVVDARPLLGIGERDPQGDGLLVIFRWDDGAAALRVDAVDEIYEVAGSSLESALAVPGRRRAGLLLGQVGIRDRLVGVINARSLVKALLEG